jgi:hypothetical protein
MKQTTHIEQLIESIKADCAKLGITLIASACDGIDGGADYDCENPLVPGVNQRLILGNSDDVESVVYDLVNTTIIDDIILKAGKIAYVFQGVRQSLNPSYELVPGTISVGYNHLVNFLAFQISQVVKDNLERLALGKVFAVIENKNDVGNGNTIFEVYGLKVGLEAVVISRVPADQETNGAFTINLSTPENEGKEPKMPQTWFDTDYPTTLAKVEALLVP